MVIQDIYNIHDIKREVTTYGEKKYLKWYNKVGYGFGEILRKCGVCHFIIILNDLPDRYNRHEFGHVGTLMMVSKLFDGVTDIFFGSMIDKTKSKNGQGRPWMLWAYIDVQQ